MASFPMPLFPTWEDLAIRLLLALLAGIAIGYNREETGHAAGLRTTILVCLAAAIAMMQANILLPQGGKTADSLVTLDLMRFPLGILTGVGFIGAGAVLRRGSIVQGVTTAATMWFVTVIGLCFGGGQLALGIAATLVGMFVLWGMKWVDIALPRTRKARLGITADKDIPVEDVIRSEFPARRFRVRLLSQRYSEDRLSEARYEIFWYARPRESPPIRCLERLRAEPGVKSVEWRF
ncbi:MAG TPA: MgtC/SapB family protein [Rhizomicrobium sp.]|jgi:putative Mg2+ transporter-C (MgtC) family protein|nr:MgtC/SapB family protein [Rhizomicrobium sp.]